MHYVCEPILSLKGSDPGSWDGERASLNISSDEQDIDGRSGSYPTGALDDSGEWRLKVIAVCSLS